MIKYFEGTVFNTNADAIVNTVNCDGFMGAGLALEFALRYPNMLIDYQNKCNNSIIKVGKIDYYIDNEIKIINFPTKSNFKFPSHIKLIEDGLIDFVNSYKEHNIKSVAFPKLGCSNGGLNWEEVNILMEHYLSALDIDVFICLDTLKEAQGKEKEMLDSFNQISLHVLSQNIKLNQKQLDIIDQKRPISRFWKISKISSIGSTTYKNLFGYFYNTKVQQMQLF